MKKSTLSILSIALAASVASAQTLDRSVRPKPGPAPEISLGKTETFTLPNGLKVFVVENHKLPTVNYSIELDIKPELEGDMIGYQGMIGDLMKTGTKNRTKDKLNEEIDFIGASIYTSHDGVSGSSLKKHQEKLLDLMSDIVLNSVFKQDELDKIKKRTLSGLEAEKNEPDAMLNNVTAVVNFGKDHPYGEVATPETVEAITLDKCRAYYGTYFHPNVAYLAIVGDITVKEVKPLIEKYFGGWQKAEVPVAKYKKPTPPGATTVSFVPRDAAVQSVINVTYPIELQPGATDVIKAKIANTILGGGSQGRLFLNLREQHAWTYGSYSSISEDDEVGSFTAYAKCRNAVTDSSVNEIIAEMNRLKTEAVDAESLENTKTYLSGGFAIGLEDPRRVAQYAINIDRYHMPADYYKNYLKNVAAVTAEDIKMTATKYIHPDQANIVVVGSRDEVAARLKRFSTGGEMKYYDNYGNEIKVTSMKPAPEGFTFSDIMKKNVATMGGEKVIKALKDISITMEAEVQGMTLSLFQKVKSPSKSIQGMKMMGAVQYKKVLNGDKGYQMAGPNKSPLSAVEVAEAKEEADFLFPIHSNQYGFTRTVKGIDQIEGKEVYVVEAKMEETVVTEYYDATTGLLVRKVSMEEGPQGTVAMTVDLSDYKEVPGGNGYKIPYSISLPLGPGMTTVAKVTEVAINKNISDKEFE